MDSAFLNKWEYYKNDIDMLGDSFNNVIICSNYLSCFYNILINPKAIIYCWWWHTSAPIILFSKIFARFVICTGAIHMFDYSGAPDFYNRSFFHRFLIRFSLKYSSLNIFISQDQYDSVSSHIKVGDYIVLHSSLSKNTSYTHNDLHENTYIKNSNELKFLYFSWLSIYQIQRKGLLYLIDAFSLFVKNINKHSRLIIGGKSGDALPLIYSYAKTKDVYANIDFLLDVDASQKKSLYISSDLLITPSYMEGFGNATLESMSYGCPVIVSRFGASHEVVGNSGFIINSISSESILDKLIEFYNMTNSSRKELRFSSFSRAHSLFNYDLRVKKFKSSLKTRLLIN